MNRNLLHICTLVLVGILATGCKSEKILDVNYENYKIYDIDDGTDLSEMIEVSIENNEISKNDISTIFDNLENKNMNTELSVLNVQGIEIAHLTERDGKIDIEISEGYENKVKNNVNIKGTERLKENVKLVREKTLDIMVETVEEIADYYVNIGNAITEDVIETAPATFTKVFIGKTPTNIDSMEKQHQDFLSDDELKTKYDFLLEMTYKFDEIIKYAEAYDKDEKSDHLESFKQSVYSFKDVIDRYNEV